MKTCIKPVISAALILFIATIFFTSCGSPGAALNRNTSALASRMDAEFKSVRETLQALTASINAVYSNSSKLDLSVHKMDVKDGGLFETMSDFSFYYKASNDGVSYYCSPMAPVSDRIKREIRIMTHFEKDMKAAYEKHKDIITVSMYAVHEPMTIAAQSPWLLTVSTYPKAISIMVFEFYRRGQALDKGFQWSDKPFTDLVSGWVMDVVGPVLIPDGRKGVAVVGVNLASLAEKMVRYQDFRVLLIDSESTLLAMSTNAAPDFGLKVLKDFDYIRQMKENTFAPEQFKLTATNQPPALREAAEKIINGVTEIKAQINGRSYLFRAERLKEVKLIVVGYTAI